MLGLWVALVFDVSFSVSHDPWALGLGFWGTLLTGSGGLI